MSEGDTYYTVTVDRVDRGVQPRLHVDNKTRLWLSRECHRVNSSIATNAHNSHLVPSSTTCWIFFYRFFFRLQDWYKIKLLRYHEK